MKTRLKINIIIANILIMACNNINSKNGIFTPISIDFIINAGVSMPMDEKPDMRKKIEKKDLLEMNSLFGRYNIYQNRTAKINKLILKKLKTESNPFYRFRNYIFEELSNKDYKQKSNRIDELFCLIKNYISKKLNIEEKIDIIAKKDECRTLIIGKNFLNLTKSLKEISKDILTKKHNNDDITFLKLIYFRIKRSVEYNEDINSLIKCIKKYLINLGYKENIINTYIKNKNYKELLLMFKDFKLWLEGQTTLDDIYKNTLIYNSENLFYLSLFDRLTPNEEIINNNLKAFKEFKNNQSQSRSLLLYNKKSQ